MAILSVQTPFEDSNTVTSSSLNQLVTQASFTSSAVDNDSTQISGTAIVVADGGIDKTKLDSSLQGFLELSGSAYIGGDKTGDTRGTNAIDISANRGSTSKVASGPGSILFGNVSQALGTDSIAIGISANANAEDSIVVGTNSYATGLSGLAFGKQNTVSGASNSNAFGVGNVVSGEESASFGQYNNITQNRGVAIGRNIEMGGTANGTVEIGNWNSAKTVRQGAVNIKDNNQVSFTINSTTTAPTDGGATAGHENDGELGRGMWTIQLEEDNDIIFYLNDGGNIRSLTLGSLP